MNLSPPKNLLKEKLKYFKKTKKTSFEKNCVFLSLSFFDKNSEKILKTKYFFVSQNFPVINPHNFE